MNQNEVLRTICAELNLDENDVVNAYQFGSHVYGTNDASSDRDYLLVVRQSRPALQFTDGIKYFHGFDLKRLFDQYDVCVHSCENFEALLEHHYLLAVECVFYPEEFILKNTIDYRSIFLTRYYNPLRLRQVSLHEREFSLQQCDYERNYGRHPSSLSKTEDSSRVMLKTLFHGVRYLDVAEQLISAKTIGDFRRLRPFFFRLKEMYQTHGSYDLYSIVDTLEEQGAQLIRDINERIVQSLDVTSGTCCIRVDPVTTTCAHLVHPDCLARAKQTSATTNDDFVVI